MNDILLSIIIPVYNGEKFLEKCVMSIINQPLSNLEIIIINDGSEDETKHICDKLKNKYDFINIIHKKNEGVAIARNVGIKASKGKYIAFLDSDDVWSKNFYNKNVYDLLNKNYDMIGFGYSLTNENMDRYRYIECKNEVLDKCSQYEKVVKNYGRHHSSYLYKKSLIEKNNIQIIGIYNEDEIFRNKCLYKSNEICYINENIFYYRNNPMSVTHKSKDIKKSYNDIIESWISLKEWFFRTNEDDKQIQNHCDNMIAALVLEMIQEMCKSKLIFNLKNKKFINEKYYEYLPILNKFYWDLSKKREYELYVYKPHIYAIKYFVIGRCVMLMKFTLNNSTILRRIKDNFKYNSSK